MKHRIAALILTAAALPAAAHARASGEAGSSGSALTAGADDCMLRAVVAASYTDVADDEVYGIARARCGDRGLRVEANEVEARAGWTRSVGMLRDRRRQHEALYGLTAVAAR